MLQIHDIRESRLYQEAKEEGLKEGIEKGFALSIARMAAKKMTVSEIANLLELDVEQVQQALSHVERN